VNLFDAEMKYLYDNGFTVLTMADLGYDESTHQLYIRYIGPSTIKHIGPTKQTEAVPDDDDNDGEEEEDDMGLESDNDVDIGFDNDVMEEDYEGNSNEFSESTTEKKMMTMMMAVEHNKYIHNGNNSRRLKTDSRPIEKYKHL
jgi:hypothetical protein